MQTLDLFRKIVLLGALLLCSDVIARDLGQYGTRVYDIAEEDAAQMMMRKVEQNTGKTGMQAFVQDMKNRSEKYVRRPPGANLPRARKNRAVEFDPSLQLSEDIMDAEGNVLYAAGTVINPLDYRSLTKTMCFIDADDVAQVRWVQKNCASDVHSILILTKGDVVETTNLLKRQVYFDQMAKLKEHFELSAVPSTIRQKGRMLLIEEYAVE